MGRGWILAFALLALSWRAEARPFIVAGGSDMPPYQFTGIDGHPSGILVNLYGECFRRLGIEFEYETYPWGRAQSRVQDGQADAMSTVSTDKRLTYAVPGTETLAVERLVAFANRNNPHFDDIMKATSLDDLKGMRFLAQISSGWAEQNLSKDQIVQGNSPDDLLVMLAVNRADLLIDDVALTRQRLAALGTRFPNLPFDAIASSEHPITTLEFHMMISKKSPYFTRLKDIDRVLGEMRKDGAVARIYGQFGLTDQTTIPLTDTPAPDEPPRDGAK